MKKIVLYSILLGTFFLTSSRLDAQQQLLMQKVDTLYHSVSALKISGSFAKISIANSTTADLQLNGELKANEKVAGFILTHTCIAGTLEIVISYPKNNWVTHSGEIKIAVPTGISIDIENTSGYIDIVSCEGLKVNATTTSGKIALQNSKGDYALRSTSGDISVNKCEGSLMLTSSSAKISASDCIGEVNITNLSGESSVILLKGNVIAESTSGKILCESITGNITAKSASAAMKISKIVGNLTLKSFSGTINMFDTKGVIICDSGAGDQLGGQLNLTGNSKFISTEGSIKVRLLNPTTDLMFKLVSQEGFIQVRGQSKKKKLNFGKGALLIESFSTTGGQVIN